MQQITNDAVTTVNTLYVWLTAALGLLATLLGVLLTASTLKRNRQKDTASNAAEIEAKATEKAELNLTLRTIGEGVEEIKSSVKELTKAGGEMATRLQTLEQQHKSDMQAVEMRFKSMQDACEMRHAGYRVNSRRISKENTGEN
jgi:DNA repair exonuclease SbcCD ATPase subunit